MTLNWLRVQQSAAPATGLVRDTPEGRRQIEAAIARLRDWCWRTETPWLPQERADG